MIRKALLFITYAIAAFAMDAAYWSYESPFSLRKDEFAVFEIDNNILTVRWSLFHNKGLVTHIKYDHMPYQNILYDDYKLNAMKIAVKTNTKVTPPLPYVMIVFEGFDRDRNVSNMKLYLFDHESAVTIRKVSDDRS
ncbi:hypothetical protein AGMMS50229_04670 [Campylobacterota bacterium]|nr:hypothetical protein AGMMS50229_04670 [Campylobacterota bacterium]